MISLLELVKKESRSFFQGRINVLKPSNELLGFLSLSGSIITDATNLTDLIYSTFDHPVTFIKEPEITDNKLNLSIIKFEELYLKCFNFHTKVMKFKPDNAWMFSSKNVCHAFSELINKFQKVESIYHHSPYSPFETTKYFIFFQKNGWLQKIN